MAAFIVFWRGIVFSREERHEELKTLLVRVNHTNASASHNNLALNGGKRPVTHSLIPEMYLWQLCMLMEYVDLTSVILINGIIWVQLRLPRPGWPLPLPHSCCSPARLPVAGSWLKPYQSLLLHQTLRIVSGSARSPESACMSLVTALHASEKIWQLTREPWIKYWMTCMCLNFILPYLLCSSCKGIMIFTMFESSAVLTTYSTVYG